MNQSYSAAPARLAAVCLCLLLLTFAGAASAQDGTTQTYDGYLDNEVSSKDYPFEMQAGQAVVITAEATSGDLDSVIELRDADGNIVSSNDDRADGTLDSALGYISESGGLYTLRMTRYEGTESSGFYRLTITVGDPSILEQLDAITRIQLSGAMQSLQTEHFRIHYTERGDDRADAAFVQAVAQAVELAWQVEIVELGWPAPPPDTGLGGDSRYDVYLKDLIGSGEGALGYTSPENIVGDNPSTREQEDYAGTSYIVLDNDYADTDDEGAESREALMLTTMVHEFNHALQFGFDVEEPMRWIFEATAAWMETAGAGKDQDATGYVEYAYTYPELCWGTVDDQESGLLQYGAWPFLQSLADAFGPQVVIDIWAGLAKYDDFEGINQALASYDTDMVGAMERMRVQDLARDYDLAPEFNATVWLENTIDGPGSWSFTGEGIQELGTNYFALDLAPGAYTATLDSGNRDLRLWMIGVTGDAVEGTPLGSIGSFDTSRYDDAYLMVFNPVYDDDVSECVYDDYQIELQSGVNGTIGTPTVVFSSRYYERLE